MTAVSLGLLHGGFCHRRELNLLIVQIVALISGSLTLMINASGLILQQLLFE